MSKRFGSEVPRVFTPPLRDLTPETSLGFDVIAFASEELGVELFPWQRWLLVHALELLPDGSFRFRNVVVLVARQNGKSTLSQVLALWFLYVYGARTVLGTAQDLDTAEEVWRGAVDLVTEVDDETGEPVRPAVFDEVEKVVGTNGQKALVLRGGARYKVKAANRRAGRGLTGDLVMLDELREHQTWDAWGAITKTTTARKDAQVWALSNAGDATSVVLRYLRKVAHAAVGDPDGINAEDDPTAILEAALQADEDVHEEDVEVDTDDLGLFEWSAPPGCDVMDPDGWAWANPSLGHTITERVLRSGAKTDPEWVFRTEALCQWTDGTLDGPFPMGSWDAGITNEELSDPSVACVDVAWDRSSASIVFAGRDSEGRPQVEVVASRAGTEWVVGWLKDRVDQYGLTGVVAQKSGPAGALWDALDAARVPLIDMGGSEVARACGAFYDLVRGDPTDETAKCGDLRHRRQPVLDVAAATAVSRPLGDAWAFDRKKSPVDIAPLMAAVGAVWALTNGPKPSRYDEQETGLIIL